MACSILHWYEKQKCNLHLNCYFFSSHILVTLIVISSSNIWCMLFHSSSHVKQCETVNLFILASQIRNTKCFRLCFCFILSSLVLLCVLPRPGKTLGLNTYMDTSMMFICNFLLHPPTCLCAHNFPGLKGFYCAINNWPRIFFSFSQTLTSLGGNENIFAKTLFNASGQEV